MGPHAVRRPQAQAGWCLMTRWDCVPAELKLLDRWVCWRLVEKNGRKTKMPVCAATGKMASSTDPATWCSFEQAVASVGDRGAAGIGLVFAPDCAYTRLDLDHVLHDGVLDEEYRWVVDAAGTYTEVSPSGDGLHLYFRGSKPAGAERCRRGPVEMYDHDRFFTVTGVPFGKARAVAAAPGVVEKAYRLWVEPDCERMQPTLASALAAPAVSQPVSQRACSGVGNAGGADVELSDDELVRRMRACRNGAEISALLDGDMAAQGNDHSAADMALCNHLAFWCAGDAGRMDRIFRFSGLMRGKWDSRRGGTTYGAQTIERALRQATEFYMPRAARRVGAGGAAGAVAVTDTNICSTTEPGGGARGIPDASAPARETEPATADFAAAPVLPGWAITRDGRLHTCDADGTIRRYVTSTPPWVACDLWRTWTPATCGRWCA